MRRPHGRVQLSHIVGRYDGANVLYREAHRRNFNQLFNPFVLLVSRVGEEGIDLQQQCRYVIHYDMEWNPERWSSEQGVSIEWAGAGPMRASLTSASCS